MAEKLKALLLVLALICAAFAAQEYPHETITFLIHAAFVLALELVVSYVARLSKPKSTKD
ncbi:hypothetical protein [Nocardia sp. NBC_00511]|uniref:hypothetical protein n=1 Tax=Nocardia sp. NBC_00511 TaxID=2903591 RepID=UPI0030E38BD9